MAFLPSPRALDAVLSRANCFSELVQLADAAGLRQRLEQPANSLFTRNLLAPQLADRVRLVCSVRENLTLRDLLTDRELWHLLKRHTAGHERTQVLRAARALLEAPDSAGVAPDASASQEGPSAAAPVGTSGPQLEVWAAAHGLADALETPARVLMGRLAPEVFEQYLRAAPWGTTIGDLVIEPMQRGRRSSEDRRPGIQQARAAARAWFGEQAAFVRTGRDEESAGPSLCVTPSEPGLAELAHALRRERAQVRKHQSPFPRRLVREGEIAVDRRHFVLRYRDLHRTWGVFRNSAERAVVTIPLERSANRLGATCDCGPVELRSDAACGHVLDAIDAALDAIADSDSPARKAILEALCAPAWSRTLDALESLAANEGDPLAAEGVRLIWRLYEVDGPAGSLRLRSFVQRPSRRGGFTNGVAVSPEAILQSGSPLLSRADRQAADALLRDSYASGAATRSALAALAGSSNVYAAGKPESPLRVVEAPLELVGVLAADGSVSLAPGAAGTPFEEFTLRSSRALQRSPVFVRLDTKRGECVVVRVDRRVLEAWEVLSERPAPFPPEAADALVQRLADRGFPVALPEPLLGRAIAPAVEPFLVLTRPEPLALVVEAHVRPLPSGLSFPSGTGPELVRAGQSGDRVFCRRSLDAEHAGAIALFERLGLGAPSQRPARATVEGQRALELVRTLEALSLEGLIVQWPPSRPTFTRAPRLVDVRLRVREGRDWFGLDGSVELDGEQVALAAVLDAARKRERFVRLEGDRWMELSADLAARLAPVAHVAFDGRKGTEVGLGAMPALEALAGEVGELELCASFAELLRRVRQAREVDPTVPAELKAELRPYQRDGFRWLARLGEWGAGACLADDMGLGKTLQALALLLHRRERGPALVVAPTSVCFNWESEAARFAPSLRVVSYHRAERDGVIDSLGPGDVLVTSYGLLTRDAARFASARFGTLVLDEAQAIKNAAALRSRAVRDLSAEFRVALTGTPLENHLGELWSLFRAILPGLLGSEEQFRHRFWTPIERGRDAGRQRALSNVLRPFLLRRTKGEVASELPPKIEIAVPVALSAEERALYEEARLAAVAELAQDAGVPPEQRRFRVLASLTRLRLLACHPRLHDASWRGPTSKLEAVLRLVDELRDEGHRALVFSQFTRHLDVVREALSSRGVPFQYLDGSTAEAERRTRVEAFQRGEGDVFLISLKAGGTGLNLTGADYVIHLDPWWNPAVEDQATDRAHRIGQSRPVTVYRLVTRGTIEEKILALHAEKRELVAGVLDGSGVAARLDTSELASLLQRSVSEDDAGGGV